MNFEYSINKASQEALQQHLVSTGDDFIPPLAQRVNISEYTTKLMLYACRIEAWQDNTLAGLIAVYTNNNEGRTAYISSVSVEKPYRGYKLAKKLLQKTCEHCRSKGFNTVELEVNHTNRPAQNLYLAEGFVVVKTENSSLFMKKQLGDHHVTT